MCQGKSQGAAAKPRRWKPWPKICATQPLCLIQDYPMNTWAVQTDGAKLLSFNVME